MSKLEKVERLVPPEGYICIRCEAKGVRTQADVFVETDGLLNNDMYPLCFRCKREWEVEYNSLMTDEFDEL
jgi:DNA-directed RNA polymerase subunit RPC12/RpoP